METIEKIKIMEYSEQKMKLITILIEELRRNTMEKGASFTQRYFLHKGLKTAE